MSKLRSDFSCPVFGHGRDLPQNVLPTYEDVLRLFLLVHHSKDNQYRDVVATSCEEVALKLEDIWNQASIPVINHKGILRRIRSYYDKYRSLLKPYKQRKEVASYLQQIQAFKEKAEVLFDISTCKCTSFDACICEKERKIPIKERQFLCDQRSERKMKIGGIDRQTTKSNINILLRKRRRQDYEEKNKSTEEHTSFSLTARTSRTDMSLSTQDQASNNPSLPAVKNFPVVARTLDRYGVSDRAGAAIVSAALQDAGLISQDDVSNVVDRSKIRRSRTKERITLCNQPILMDCDQFGLYFDGRKDKTLTVIDNRRKIIMEEHISLVKEPGSEYIGHLSLKVGNAKMIGNSIVNYISYVDINLVKLVAIGCDGTAVNTGHKGGSIRHMELRLKRPLQWLVCQLHANELNLRHLFEHIDGTTCGPRSFTGVIGKSLQACEELPVEEFIAINCTLPQISNKQDLSTDQAYLLNICEAISLGSCNESLSKKNPGKIVHSRWLTTANRILRLYISTKNPSEALLTLTTFVIKVYAPMWFHIKTQPSCIFGARHLYQTIVLSRYLTSDLKQIIDPVIQRNGYFGHPENVLLSMLADTRTHIRELALRKILKARQTKTILIRPFKLQPLNFDAEDYTNLIELENVTEPPLTKFLSDQIISEAIVDQTIIDKVIAPAIKGFPCHTQATERCVKMVTEASAAVCGPFRRHGFIKNRLESRKVMPVFNTKKEYRLM